MRNRTSLGPATSPQPSHKRKASSLSVASIQSAEPSPLDSTSSAAKRRRRSRKPSVDLLKSDDISEHEDEDQLQAEFTQSALRFSSADPSTTPRQLVQQRRVSSPPVSFPAEFEERQFTPLRAKIDPRTRRRLRRSHLSEEMNDIYKHDREHARTHEELEQERKKMAEMREYIRTLEQALAEAHQQALDVGHANAEELERVQTIAKELEKAQQELQEKNDELEDAQSFDDNLGPVSTQTEADYHELDAIVVRTPLATQTTNSTNDSILRRSFYVTTANSESSGDASTQVALPDLNHARQLELYEERNRQLFHQIADLKADLTKLEYDVKGVLGGETVASALSSATNTFEHVREEVDRLLPGWNAASIGNLELVRALPNHLANLKDELDSRTAHLREHQRLNGELNDGIRKMEKEKQVLEARKEHLEAQWYEMDVDREIKEKELVEARAEIEQLQDALDANGRDLAERHESATKLGEELDDTTKSLQRITQAMERYREEAEKFAKTVERQQEHHEAVVSQMTQDHNEAIKELALELADEQDVRRQAENISDERQTFITQLELKIEELETDLDQLRDRAHEMEDLYETEKEKGADLEEEVFKEQQLTEELGNRIDVLTEELNDMKADLDRLRQQKDSERSQREAAETELDAARAQIAELDEKIKSSGLREQEFRMKLFEVQQTNQAAIEDLQRSATDREEHYQQDLTAEIARREKAESEIKEQQKEIDRLTSEVKDTVKEMASYQSQQEALVSELQEDRERLEQDLEQTQDAYATLMKEKNDAIGEFESRIDELSLNLEDARSTIETMTKEAIQRADASQNAIEERDERIDGLEHQLQTSYDSISTLESQKASLERRVEEEAAQMLELQDVRSQELEQLQKTISAHTSTISDLTALVGQRDQEITMLKAQSEEDQRVMEEITAMKDETIASLRRKLSLEKDRVQRLVEDAEDVVEAQARESEAAAVRNTERANAYLERARKELGASLAESSPMPTPAKTNGTQNEPVREENADIQVNSGDAVKKTAGKKGRKRRTGIFADSGFGVATSSDVEEAMMA